MAIAMKPSNEPAQLTPSLLNIWRANSGNPAAKAERRKVFAAMADAALFFASLLDWTSTRNGRGD